jgi:hypothetical protein
MDDLLVDALTDEMRLSGARLNDVDHLRGKLRKAVETLSATAATYLNEPPRGEPAPGAPDSTAVASAAGSATDAAVIAPAPYQNGAASAVAPGPSASATTEARIALRQVRRAINNFRDESRSRLVRSRTRLLATMTFTGVITYILLAFAVNLRDIRQDSTGLSASDPIVAAAAFYLVGAVVGLFNRLYVESGDEAAGEDYGLSRARLLLTPMLSGLAAIGGVLITGMLSGVVSVNAVTPSIVIATPTPTSPPPTVAVTATPGPDGAGPSAVGANASPSDPSATGSTGATGAKTGAKTATLSAAIDDRRTKLVPNQPLSVGDVFTLRDYPFGLVLAALFGLTPKAFLERLQRSSEQSRLDLRSTDAHQSSLGASADAAPSARA